MCTLDAKTVERVLPGKWINDEIINAVAHVLENRYETLLRFTALYSPVVRRPNKMINCMVATTWIFPSMESASRGELMRKVRRFPYSTTLTLILARFEQTSVFSLRNMVIPINVDNVHWITADISFAQRLIYFYDSLVPSTNKEMQMRYDTRAKVSETMMFRESDS